MDIRDDTMKLATILIAYENVGWTDKYFFHSLLLNALLGNWNRTDGFGTNKSARIAEIFSLDPRIGAEYYKSFYHPYNNTGLFGFIGAVDSWHGRLDDFMYHQMNDIQRLYTYIQPDELQRARNTVKASLLKHLDTPSQHSSHLAYQILTTDKHTPNCNIYS